MEVDPALACGCEVETAAILMQNEAFLRLLFDVKQA